VRESVPFGLTERHFLSKLVAFSTELGVFFIQSD
jgi:hypothetical protein